MLGANHLWRKVKKVASGANLFTDLALGPLASVMSTDAVDRHLG